MITLTKKDNSIPRDILHSIPVPKKLPKWNGERPQNSFWKPVNHGVLADTVVEKVTSLGFLIKEETWITLMNGMGLMGNLELAPSPSLDTSIFTKGVSTFGDFEAQFLGLHLLVRHSNNARWALQTMITAKVLVCSNGMAIDRFSDNKVRRKHSKHLSIDEYVGIAVGQCIQRADSLLEGKRKLEDIDMSLPEGDHFIGECAVRGLLTGRHCVEALKEWREPRHPEFRSRNAWSLYNCLTEVSKDRSPSIQADVFPQIYEVLSALSQESIKAEADMLNTITGGHQPLVLPPSSYFEDMDADIAEAVNSEGFFEELSEEPSEK